MREDDQTMLAAQISGLFEAVPMRQALRMMRARNLDEFRTALAPMQMLFMNVIYADCDGNMWFLYNGRVPRRNPRFDWSQPVDGADPAAEWLGVHELDELPQVNNPAAGFLQNCNSTPFLVTDGDNPRPEDFPTYMVGDGDVRNRRSLRSLRDAARREQDHVRRLAAARVRHGSLLGAAGAAEVRRGAGEAQSGRSESGRASAPYLEHLLAWDGRITADSTAATLCTRGTSCSTARAIPARRCGRSFEDNPAAQLAALVRAAEGLADLHGNWKIPYGELYRAQRTSRVADLVDARFDDGGPSLPCLGGHGPMGVAFTQYYSPSIDVPLVISQTKRYGMAGVSYLAAWEFAPEGVRGASLVPFGASGDPRSPHYFDQAKLLSEQRMKTERFTEQQVLRHAVRSYRPGEDLRSVGRLAAFDLAGKRP